MGEPRCQQLLKTQTVTLWSVESLKEQGTNKKLAQSLCVNLCNWLTVKGDGRMDIAVHDWPLEREEKTSFSCEVVTKSATGHLPPSFPFLPLWFQPCSLFLLRSKRYFLSISFPHSCCQISSRLALPDLSRVTNCLGVARIEGTPRVWGFSLKTGTIMGKPGHISHHSEAPRPVWRLISSLGFEFFFFLFSYRSKNDICFERWVPPGREGINKK